jgi:hypothetical protein
VSARVATADKTLVAVICEVPLLAEALAASLGGIARIESFPADLADLDGLLRSLEPDAVVVDTAEQAEAGTPYASATGVPFVHVLIRESELRVRRNGVWESRVGTEAASPEGIRNALVAGMLRRQHA